MVWLGVIFSTFHLKSVSDASKNFDEADHLLLGHPTRLLSINLSEGSVGVYFAHLYLGHLNAHAGEVKGLFFVN